MKLSNYMLSLVAVVVTSAAVFATTHIISTNPTTVISIPKEERDGTFAGDNITLKLPENLSDRQAKLLSMAYQIAKEDGHRYPQILQGIILQETHAGELRHYKVAGQEFGLKTNERYYGVGQIKLSVAKDVLKRYPQLKDKFNFNTEMDEEIIAKLIEDDRFNLTVASKYLLILRDHGYDTIKQLALAYNQGPAGAKRFDSDTHHYSNGVMKYIQKLNVVSK
jgi:hypothetical protein